jgi:DNA-binding NarL/FixJ family response regulator
MNRLAVGFVDESKRVGAKGYVVKTQNGETLLQAVDALMNKQTFYPAKPGIKSF